MKSLGQMIKQLSGMIDTKDLNDWENRFVKNVVERTNCGQDTTCLSSKQSDIATSIHGKHFAQ